MILVPANSTTDQSDLDYWICDIMWQICDLNVTDLDMWHDRINDLYFILRDVMWWWIGSQISDLVDLICDMTGSQIGGWSFVSRSDIWHVGSRSVLHITWCDGSDMMDVGTSGCDIWWHLRRRFHRSHLGCESPWLQAADLIVNHISISIYIIQLIENIYIISCST